MEQPPNKSIILMKVGIIIAKSFSKRVPNKNFMNFNGKPMIYWTIQAAKKSKIFDKIIISTDSKKIITKLKKYNTEFIIRPKELNKEKYGIDEVMSYSLSLIKGKISYACCLFPCAPLMTADDIIKGYKKIQTNKYLHTFAASNFSHPIEKSFKIKNSKIKMIFSKKFMQISSKFLSDTYHDTGYFYWAKANTRKNKNIEYTSNSSFVKIPNWRAQDLDSFDDLKKVDLIFKSLNKSSF